MTDYRTCCRTRRLHPGRGLNFNKIAGELGIRPGMALNHAKIAVLNNNLDTHVLKHFFGERT